MTSEVLGEASFIKVRSRLGAARFVLGNTKRDHPESHEAVSRVQAAACVALLNRELPSLTAEHKATLTMLTTDVAWHGLDGTAVLHILCPPSALVKTRAKMQNFMSCLDFYTQREWTSCLLNREVGGEIKLHCILARIFATGGRNLSELSLRRLAALWLAITESAESLENLSDMQKKAALQMVKVAYKSAIARGTTECFASLHDLPASPLILMAEYPEFYHAVYRDGEQPVSCPAEEKHKISVVEMSIRCRGNGPAATTICKSMPIQLGSSNGMQLQQVANFFMEGMNRMAQNQDRMMNVMLQRIGPSAQSPQSGIDSCAWGCNGVWGGVRSMCFLFPLITIRNRNGTIDDKAYAKPKK